MKLSSRKYPPKDILSTRSFNKKGVSAGAVFIIIIITAVVAAAAVFFWQTFKYGDTVSINKELTKEFDKSKAENAELIEKVTSLETEIEELKGLIPSVTDKNERQIIQSKADDVLLALKKDDMNRLSAMVHPDKGVRFTPYSYVEVNKDIVLKPDELKTILTKTDKKIWGSFDGSGEPIDITFKDYKAKFVYDKDFLTAPQIIYNQTIQRGNSLNNIKQVYPNAPFIEYHFSGFDKQYEGMDWASLRLVFEKIGDEYFLVGIIHDQWTI